MTIQPVRAILDHLRREPSRTWSIVITIYGDAIVPRGGAVWLGTLEAILAAMEIGGGVVRTAMSRLAADGWLERRRQGRNSFYHLSAKGQATFAGAEARIYGGYPPHWGGRFRLVLLPDPAMRQAAREALLAAGFGAPLPGLFVAHDDTALPAEAADALCLAAGGDGAAHRRLAALAWPLEPAGRRYQRLLDAFAPLRVWLRAGRAMPDRDALVARILLVHEFRRAALRDPLLPVPLLPPDWAGLRARALCAELYPLLLPASERWLDASGAPDGDRLPPPSIRLGARFQS